MEVKTSGTWHIRICSWTSTETVSHPGPPMMSWKTHPLYQWTLQCMAKSRLLLAVLWLTPSFSWSLCNNRTTFFHQLTDLQYDHPCIIIGVSGGKVIQGIEARSTWEAFAQEAWQLLMSGKTGNHTLKARFWRSLRTLLFVTVFGDCLTANPMPTFLGNTFFSVQRFSH